MTYSAKALAWTLMSMITTATVEAGESSSRAFMAFGLEGVWSPDCKRPPSKDNPRVVWRVPADGPIFHGVTFDGSTWALTDTVTDAAILSDDSIRFSSVRNNGFTLTATLERVGERIHTTISAGSDGKVSYRDGVEVSTGRPSLFDERCDGNIPLSSIDRLPSMS